MATDEWDELLTELRAWDERSAYGEQKQLAETLGVSPKLLNHWITGRRRPNIRDGLRLQTFLRKRHPRKKGEPAKALPSGVPGSPHLMPGKP